MYTHLLLLSVLGFVLPYGLLRVFFSPNTHVVFEGKVPVCTIGVLGKTAVAKGYDYMTAIMPDGKTLIIEETREQIAKLNSRFGIATMAQVVVSKTIFGKPEISSVTWPDESAPRAAPPSNMATYLGAIYFMLGLGSLVYFCDPAQVALVGHFGTGYSVLLLAVSGWVLGNQVMKPLTEDTELRFLIFSMGSGSTVFYLTTLVVSAITVACFYAGGLFILLGINTAVATGMLLAQLFKKAAKS
jgi:hypothetical protein